MSTATALIVSSLITAAASGTAAYAQHEDTMRSMAAQENAQKDAEKKQKEADEKAERQRLEGLKSQATTTDYGNVWGAAGSKKYVDAAQKLSAGTGSFNIDDEENNPFYTKGLL